MGINNRVELLIKNFGNSPDWEGRYRSIIKLGRELEPLDESFKTDDFKVKGCQSQVWIHASLVGDKIVFKADSDALIVKGLVAVLVSVYSNSTPDEVLSTSPEFLKDLGFESNLSPNRANGLYAMVKQMMYYATAFKALLSRNNA